MGQFSFCPKHMKIEFWLTPKLLLVKSTPRTNGKTPVFAIVCTDTMSEIRRIVYSDKMQRRRRCFHTLLITWNNSIAENCMGARTYTIKKNVTKKSSLFGRNSFKITGCMPPASTFQCFLHRKYANEFSFCFLFFVFFFRFFVREREWIFDGHTNTNLLLFRFVVRWQAYCCDFMHLLQYIQTH